MHLKRNYLECEQILPWVEDTNFYYDPITYMYLVSALENKRAKMDLYRSSEWAGRGGHIATNER